ncbi:uncharacterized protein V1516DRAFT_667849 [Lipomyces oligophaga]|uniref:uncharacterized protein n=1 Tax=Lipomyces oligophaga TaxID=45792 RepID=UPI0034CF75ED
MWFRFGRSGNAYRRCHAHGQWLRSTEIARRSDPSHHAKSYNSFSSKLMNYFKMRSYDKSMRRYWHPYYSLTNGKWAYSIFHTEPSKRIRRSRVRDDKKVVNDSESYSNPYVNPIKNDEGEPIDIDYVTMRRRKRHEQQSTSGQPETATYSGNQELDGLRSAPSADQNRLDEQAVQRLFRQFQIQLDQLANKLESKAQENKFLESALARITQSVPNQSGVSQSLSVDKHPGHSETNPIMNGFGTGSKERITYAQKLTDSELAGIGSGRLQAAQTLAEEEINEMELARHQMEKSSSSESNSSFTAVEDKKISSSDKIDLRVYENVSDLQSQVSKISKRLLELETSFGSVKRMTGDVYSKTEGQEEMNRKLIGRQKSIEERQLEINSRLGKLYEDIDETELLREEVRRFLFREENCVLQVDSNLASIKEKIQETAKKIEGHDSQLSELSESMTTAEKFAIAANKYDEERQRLEARLTESVRKEVSKEMKDIRSGLKDLATALQSQNLSIKFPENRNTFGNAIRNTLAIAGGAGGVVFSYLYFLDF